MRIARLRVACEAAAPGAASTTSVAPRSASVSSSRRPGPSTSRGRTPETPWCSTWSLSSRPATGCFRGDPVLPGHDEQRPGPHPAAPSVGCAVDGSTRSTRTVALSPSQRGTATTASSSRSSRCSGHSGPGRPEGRSARPWSRPVWRQTVIPRSCGPSRLSSQRQLRGFAVLHR